MSEAVGRQRSLAFAALTLAVLFWSGNWVVSRGVLDSIPPMTLALGRWLVAALVCTAFAWRQIVRDAPAIKRHWKRVLFLAFWGTGLHNAMSYQGLQFTTATNGVILNSAIPVFIIVLNWLVYRERLTPLQAAGVLVSCLGVLTILTRADAAVLLGLQFNPGDLIVIFSMYFWAGYTIFLRLRPAEISSLSLLAACAWVGVLILAPLTVFEVAFVRAPQFSVSGVMAILYVGVCSSFLSYLLWNKGVAELGANAAGLFIHLMPVFGSVLAWLFLNERVQLYHFAGIALILGGIYLTTRTQASTR